MRSIAEAARIARLLWGAAPDPARASAGVMVGMMVLHVVMRAGGGVSLLAGLAPVLPMLLGAGREARRSATGFLGALPLRRGRLAAAQALIDYGFAFAPLAVALGLPIVLGALHPSRVWANDAVMAAVLGASSLAISWLPSVWLRAGGGIAAMIAISFGTFRERPTAHLQIAALFAVGALVADVVMRLRGLAVLAPGSPAAVPPRGSSAQPAPGTGIRLPSRRLRGSAIGLYFVSQPLARLSFLFLFVATFNAVALPERIDTMYLLLLPLQIGPALAAFFAGPAAAFLKTRPIGTRRWIGAVLGVSLCMTVAPPLLGGAILASRDEGEIARGIERTRRSKRLGACEDRDGCAAAFERAADRLSRSPFGRFDRRAEGFVVVASDPAARQRFVPGPGLFAQYRRMVKVKLAISLIGGLVAVTLVAAILLLKGSGRLALALAGALPVVAAALLATEIAFSDARTALLPIALLAAALVAAALLFCHALRRAEPTL